MDRRPMPQGTLWLALALGLALVGCGDSLQRRDNGNPLGAGGGGAGGGGTADGGPTGETGGRTPLNRAFFENGFDLNEVSVEGTTGTSLYNPVTRVLSLRPGAQSSLAGLFATPAFEMPQERIAGFAVLPARPYGYPLPTSQGKDTGFPYGNVDMAGNEGLYELDELLPPYRDGSGKGRHGASGNAPAAVEGTLGLGQKFTGAQSVEVGTSPVAAMASANQGTFMAWVTSANPAANGVLLQGGSDANIRIRMGSSTANPTLQCEVYGSSKRATTAAPFVRNSQGRYTHVACVFNGSRLQLFLNGLLVASTNTTATLGNSGTNRKLYLGRYGSAAWKGNIDQAVFFSRALTASEVMDIVRRGQTTLEYAVRWGDTPEEISARPFIGLGGPNTTFRVSDLNSFSPPIFGHPIITASLYQVRFYVRGNQPETEAQVLGIRPLRAPPQ